MPPFRRLGRLLHRSLLHPLLDALLPSACFGCGTPLPADHHLGACAGCWSGLRGLAGPCCPACAAPTPSGTDLLGPAGGRCFACVAHAPGPDATVAAIAYDRLARRFLLRAKNGRRREILPVLGGQIARAVVLSRIAEGCTVVIPVPSHPARLLRRGFNPAFEIARPVARATGLALDARTLRRSVLRWRPAKRLGRSARRAAVREAFRARDRLEGHSVLLVDDVMTTGATLSACAAALRAGGACEVRAAVWARTLRRSGPV